MLKKAIPIGFLKRVGEEDDRRPPAGRIRVGHGEPA